MLTEPQSPEAEEFRVLRANLEFTSIDSPLETILITSSVEQEGKSTTIANLAATMARAGRRVLLVDLDLRRPTLHRMLGTGPHRGVTEVVRGLVPLEDAIVRIDVRAPGSTNGRGAGASMDSGQFQVLLAGSIPPDPGEFVASHAVGRLLDECRQHADVVLIDAPPVLRTGDAVHLSSYADGVFVLARLPELRRPMLDELRRTLTTMRCRVLGVVLTGKGAPAAGYGYTYGYSYGAEGIRVPSLGQADRPSA
jgi:Mrp family chromosome partitioning ATPase